MPQSSQKFAKRRAPTFCLHISPYKHRTAPHFSPLCPAGRRSKKSLSLTLLQLYPVSGCRAEAEAARPADSVELGGNPPRLGRRGWPALAGSCRRIQGQRSEPPRAAAAVAAAPAALSLANLRPGLIPQSGGSVPAPVVQDGPPLRGSPSAPSLGARAKPAMAGCVAWHNSVAKERKRLRR